MAKVHVMQFIGNSIVGGMETYVERLIERLPAERFRVSAVVPWECDYSERLRALGAEVMVLAMPEDPCWDSICSAAAFVRAEQVDVLQAHLSNAHVLAGLVGRLSGAPVLYTNHGRRLTTEDLEVQRLAGTHVGVVCRYTELHALGLGLPRSHVHRIPNGVDTGRFAPQRQRPGPLRRRFGIAPEAPLVGFVGRLSVEKGPETFLRSVLLAHHAVPELHAVMVGVGPMGPNVEAFIGGHGMAGYAHLAGLQPDMPSVLNELDLFVTSSHSEAMPLALMEAMACGLPVVGTRAGGVQDMIQHGVNGYLVARADINAIASAIRGLLQEPERREAYGRAARAFALERFSLDASVNATSELLQRLAAQRVMAANAPTAERLRALSP
jgi:glycosyltransferase involved in cell wall biosynthesis